MSRLAIHAAESRLEADFIVHGDGRKTRKRATKIQGTEKSRGSFKGAIRIPRCSLILFFNDLALLRILRKSLKFRRFLFSIPTALPT
jgi:hypothetical protein